MIIPCLPSNKYFINQIVPNTGTSSAIFGTCSGPHCLLRPHKEENRIFAQIPQVSSVFDGIARGSSSKAPT